MILHSLSSIDAWKKVIKFASLLTFLISWPGLSSAIGFGQLNVLSSLGQPLKIIIPLRLDAQETLRADCVKLVKNSSSSGLAVVQDAKITLRNQNKDFSLLVTSTQAFEEPAAQISIQVGCVAPVTRDFVLLLDPPLGDHLVEKTASSFATEISPVKPATASANPVATLNVASSKASSETAKTKTSSVNPKPSAANTKAASAAPEAKSSAKTKTSKAAASTQKRRDRLVLAPSSSGNYYQGFRLSDSLSLNKLDSTPAVQASPASAPNAAEQAERARLLAILKGENYDALMADKQASLVGELSKLNNQTKQLQTQLQQESARRQAAEAQRRWLYGAIALLALGLVAAFWWFRKKSLNQQLQQSEQQKAWWQSTQMPQVEAEEELETIQEETSASAFVPSELQWESGKATNPANSKTKEHKGARNFDLEIEFPDRLQDNNIEVQELGHEDAIEMLQKTGRLELPDLAVPDAGVTSTQVGVSASTELAELDFDLGSLDAPSKTEPAESEEQSVHAVPFGRPGVPLSMETARQAQKHMRQVAEAIEQADAYIGADQNETAASVLRKFINEKPAIPRAPWLMLLALYQKTAKREPYEALSVRFSRVYGRAAPAWEQAASAEQEIGLDSDPTLMQSIWAHWGTAESMELLLKQLYDTSLPDDKFFNLTLQRDLLNFAKICPLDTA